MWDREHIASPGPNSAFFTSNDGPRQRLPVCGCKILMKAYGFGPDIQIQCILYGKLQNPDCAVRIAVKRLDASKLKYIYIYIFALDKIRV